MIFEDGAIIGAMDVYGYYVAHGWALDRRTGKFPSVLSLTSDEGLSRPIEPLNLILRPDVNDAHSIANDQKLGFHVNLADAFNCRPTDYSLWIAENEAWSLRASLTNLHELPLEYISPPAEIGEKQVIIVYENAGLLHECISQICQWQKQFFTKSFCSGVAFYFIELEKLHELEERVYKGKPNLVTICEESAYARALRINNSIFLKNVIVMEDNLGEKPEFNSLLSGLYKLSGIKKGGRLCPELLFRIVSSLYGYTDLFFPPEGEIFTYQSGATFPWAMSFIQKNLQEKCAYPVVVFCDKLPRRASDLNTTEMNVLVNMRHSRYCLDIFDLSPQDFVLSCLKRGVRVKFFDSRSCDVSVDI